MQLYHKSQIWADLADLKKFNIDGTLKPRIIKYNEDLLISITREIEAMREGYNVLKSEITAGKPTSKGLEEKISRIRYPGHDNRDSKEDSVETLYQRFVRFVNTLEKHGMLSSNRIATYHTVRDKLQRFLAIYQKVSYTSSDFNCDDILKFREFMINEYKYVEKFPLLYSGLDLRSLPTRPLNQNSATLKLRALSAFFNELESNDEIRKSPFRRLSKTRRHEIMREQYDEPIALSREELQKIMNTEVPTELNETKQVFLLHCALGCRIGDFMKLDMSNVSVTEDGIPYVHYIAEKTAKTASGRKEKSTPLMLFALEIIRLKKFKFEIFNRCNTKGRILYNRKIRDLLRHCGINRYVCKYNETTQAMDYMPLHEIANSKLCRKTHIDIANKVQINMYATGLHEVGSAAVGHYSKLQICDLFKLLCIAFGQREFHVDKNLNILNK